MKTDRTTLQVRITHPERLRFERRAQSVDLSISEWARLVLRRDCDLWTGETKKMNAYHLTNEIAIDPSTECALLDNGETGDAKVTLCCATGLGRHAGEALYYLQTNGDPVLLTDNADETAAFVETLGCHVRDVIEAIKASNHGASSEWAIEQIEGVVPEGD